MGFSSYDIFKIEKKYNLSGEDLYSLTNLYLPIIGVDSFSLFLLLNQLDNNEYIMTKLLDCLNFPTINFLDQAFSKLEGIGLVKILQKKNEYLFILLSPLNVESFLDNSILASFLENKIGDVEFKKIKVGNQKHSGYKDISKSFDDVFERTTESIKNILPNEFKNLVNDSIYVKNKDFDYIIFKLSFQDSVIDQEILNDKYFKEEILKISYHYNLNEDEMKEAVLETLRVDKDLRIKDIRKNASKIYQAKSIQPIRFVTKEADPFVSEGVDDTTLRFLSLVEKTSCEELLYSLSNIKPSTSELKMLDDLRRNTGYSQGVINIMILYVLREKDGELPGYNYFEKIANTWKRAKVKTAKDALDMINKDKEPKEVEKKYQSGKVKATPEWYKEYEKSIKEATQKSEEFETKEKDLEEALASGLFTKEKE